MKRVTPKSIRISVLTASLVAVLAACDRAPPTKVGADPNASASPPAPTSVAPAPAYVPPTADQLYAMVAPIALFPDKLVALTLAASTHPDQVDAARGFLGDNRNLTGGALIDAADAQPWDPSVKSLVAFPAVVDQLATHRDWTDALGNAYANEPTDVLNAIQVMRDRARSHGALRSSTQQTVTVDDATPADGGSVASIVPAPTHTIVIEPAAADVVYVPRYDPDVVYGEPVYSRVYRTHWYEGPATRGDVVTAGLVSFGAGILVGQLFTSHDRHDSPHGGWNGWNTSWGHGPGGEYQGRPAVVYDNHPYVVNRNTVVNRTVNNTYVNRSVRIDDRHDNGNVDVHNAPPPPGNGPMQRPNFTAAMARPMRPDAMQHLPPPAEPGNDPRLERAAQLDHPARPMDPRVANVHGVGARPQPFDNSHTPAASAPQDRELPRMPPERTSPHLDERSTGHAQPRPEPMRRQDDVREHAPPAAPTTRDTATPREATAPREAPERREAPAHEAARPPKHDEHAPPAHRDERDKHEKHDD